MPGAWEIDNKVFVYVAVPESKKVTIDWALILRCLILPQNSIIRKWSGLPVHIAREVFARDALKQGAKYLFFLDSDNIIPTNTIIRLMQHRLPIISGLYFSKRGMYCAWVQNPDNKTFRMADEKDIQPNTIVQVGAVGLGCCLIDTRVFKEIPEPRFPWTQMHPERSDVPDEFSEDFNFCRKLHEAGFPTYLDSLPSYEPILIKESDGIDVLPLEDFYNSLTSQSYNIDQSEVKEVSGVYNYCRNHTNNNSGGVYWTKIKKCMRHWYEGRLVRVLTNAGVIDTSPNHSLIAADSFKLIKADETALGQRLAMPFLYDTDKFKSPASSKKGFFIGGEDLAWLYGFFAAEGSAPNSIIKLSNKNLTRLDKAQKAMERYLNHAVRRQAEEHEMYNIIASSSLIADYFRKNFYTNGKEKRVPKFIFQSPHNIQKAFLQGYFEGDGHIEEERLCSYSSNSATLAMGILWLLKNNGYHTWEVHYKWTTAKNTNYMVVLPKHDGKKYNRIDSVAVKKIELINYKGWLYDLETENNMFSAGIGLIKVHNTGLRCGHEWEIAFGPEGQPDNNITSTFLGGGYI